MSIVSSSQRTLISGLNIVATGTYYYNNTASKNSLAGWIQSKCTDLVLQIGCGTLTNPVLYRIEGKATPTSRVASIAVGNIPGTGIDKLVAVDTLKTPFVRVGVHCATVNASLDRRTRVEPHIAYVTALLTDRR